jgi:NAD-dependent dihydropyrimidine dehydrogenase PreA subunit
MSPLPKALPVIDPDRCTGCGWCVGVCAPHVLSLQVESGGLDGSPWGRKLSVLHAPGGCTGCALCALRCPFGAIRMQRTGRTDAQ